MKHSQEKTYVFFVSDPHNVRSFGIYNEFPIKCPHQNETLRAWMILIQNV
jgi:hypothetical protein